MSNLTNLICDARRLPRLTRQVPLAASFWLNVCSGIAGAGYLLDPENIPLWDVMGILLLVTLFGNLLLAYWVDRSTEKTSARGQALNRVLYGYLILTGVLYLGVLGSNFIVSAACARADANLPALSAGIYANFFGLLGVGAAFPAYVARKGIFASPSPPEADPTQNATRSPASHRRLRKLVVLVLGLFLGCGTLLAVNVFAGLAIGVDPAFPPPGLLPAAFGMAGGAFTGFWTFLVLIVAILLLKVTRVYRRPRWFAAIGITGLVLSGALLFPFFATPASAGDADARMTAAFGPQWQPVNRAGALKYFQPSRFVLPAYYLGAPPKECTILNDISFYNGTTGVDAGVTLFFDAYLPPSSETVLPGRNSTVIRIHGGGWMFTDKGPQNMPQMSRYLAAQGYVVFDIQYGLRDMIRLPEPMQPAHATGNFTVDDIVRHVGIFCQFIAARAADYGANLSSVFFMGGSAGGQLACAAALAIASGAYPSYFGTALTVRGLVPFYPATAMVDWIDNQSTPSFRHPEQLVTPASPPCLIFQGAQDGLVTTRGTQALVDAYAAAGVQECAAIYLPTAGHAADIYYTGHSAQFLQYYLERFMFLFR